MRSKVLEHRFVVHDRNEGGGRHIHRWLASCSCGKWWSIPARSIDKVARMHHGHAKTMHTGRPMRARPRPLTPQDKLPEVLRTVA
jgi:hypothetical protein